MNNYQLSPVGATFILREGHEGIRLKPYLCSANKPTIGGGCTSYENGQLVKLTDPPISMERAMTLFWNRAKEYVDCVNRVIKVPLKQHEFDALVSMCFNCGPTRFTKSHVAEELNLGHRQEVTKWFPLSFITANGIPSNGLITRRKNELKLFLTGAYI